MEERRETNSAQPAERIFDIACLAASYGILFLLPQKTGLLFYLVFGVSAFLFCIGFFRLGLTFDAPSGPGGGRAVRVLYAVSGVLLDAAAVFVIFRDHFSFRSIAAAILLAVESVIFYAMAGGGSLFNSLTGEVQTVPGLKTPVEQLRQDFTGVETQLGYPWIGRVGTIKQDSIIYGPSADGFVVYGYYLFGRFHVAGSTNPLFPVPEDAQGHETEEIPDSRGVLLAKEDLPEAYARMFERYAKSKDAQWITVHYDPADPDRSR